MIVKKKDARKRSFYGVDFILMSHGPKSMVTKMLYKETDNVPPHAHPNEQSGYVISGKFRIAFSNYDQLLEAGDTYTIPANVEHSIEIIIPGEVVDFFTPPRQDYL
jgi:quercetin dioxygenase-like cupin family protein